jgi:hypothetical protein
MKDIELLKKVYEDGQLFGPYVDFEEYYKEHIKDKDKEYIHPDSAYGQWIKRNER